MMYPYPFFGFPSYRRYYKVPFTQNTNYMHNMDNNLNQNKNINVKKNYYNSSSKNNNQNSNQNNGQNNIHNKSDNNLLNSNSQNSNSNEDFFDFFGIRLASDDLLILSLLFFLYKEEAKDPYLYFSLILLLLS